MNKNYTNYLFFCIFFFVFTFQSQSQELRGKEAHAYLKGAKLIKLNEFDKSIQYVLFETELDLSQNESIEYLKKVLKSSVNTDFKVLSKDKDNIGYTHIRLQQLLEGVPVLGGIYIMHFKGEKLHSMNGVFIKLESKSTTLSEAICLKNALDSTGAQQYMWESEMEEHVIKEIKEDEYATWYPKGELMYVPESLNFKSDQFYLCYKFNIHTLIPRTAENVFVDANTGKIVARENQLHTTDVNGLAYTKYSGQKAIVTDSTAPFNYRLRENSRGNGIYTLNLRKTTNYGGAVDFTDSNNYWNNVNTNKDEVATDCHWGAETTYDYYKNKFNRNSYNNNNARILSYVHYSNNYDNAFWDGFRMTYGDGNVFKPLTSIDVCGHEITHAVTSNTANLIYSYESGQLNESFSDIFGNSIERYGKPNDYSWKIGEEITVDSSGLRNMFNPKLKGHPRCYKSTNWYFGTADNGGVHLNSGVQNWWYYLITEGGSGTNDVSNVYDVDSLGILSAEQIAYRNLTVYLTPSSQYADARFYSIRAAVDLFGECSKEVIAVTNAWYACNVGPAYDSGYVKADFSADTIVCRGNSVVNFKNLSSNANNVLWYFGDGNTSAVYNATHTYNTYGSFTIKLVANSCFKNKSDSITKVAFVKVDSTFDICNSVFMPKTGLDSTNKCESFVYDEGGEGDYQQNKTIYFRISVPGADSIRIKFYDLDYELNFDSLYIYKGIYPGTGTLIGGYTGTNLPNSGSFFSVAGSVVTLKQFSDPYLVGRGFKLYYKAYRKPLTVTAFSDTSICIGSGVKLFANGQGGYKEDYQFYWKQVGYGDTITVKPLVNTIYKVYLKDVCSNARDSSEIEVKLRDPLKIHLSKDTLLCQGQKVLLQPYTTGGDTANYVLTWNNGLGTGKSKLLSPLVTTTYRIILSDNCSEENDTVYYTVRVKDSLKVKLNASSTKICFNKLVNIQASASGGDTMQYQYTWSEAGGMQNNIQLNLNTSKWIKVELSDNCSVSKASDSVFIRVNAPLTITKSNDTMICYGSSTVLSIKGNGGDTSNYTFEWTPGFGDTSRVKVSPKLDKKYYITLKDNCSDNYSDSILVRVMDPIEINGLRDTLICNGNLVDLKPNITGGVPSNYTYTWNFGLSAQANQSVTPSFTRVYRLIVGDGCTFPNDTALVNITVKPVLDIEVLSEDTLICFNRFAKFKTNSKGGVPADYTYTWNNGLGNADTSEGVFVSSQWVSVELSDGCTVNPGKDSIYIVVRDPLTVQLNKDTSMCYGSSINLLATTGGGDTNQYVYTWTQGLSSVKSHTINPKINTQYIVKINDNCSDEAADTVDVTVLEPLDISGIRDTTLCYGNSLALSATYKGGDTNNYTIQWDNGLGNVAQPVVKPLSNTSYKVTLRDACTVPYDSLTVNVTVLSPLDLDAKLNVNEICEEDSAILTLTLSGGKSNSYQWFLNENQISEKVIALKPMQDTEYRIELRDNCSEAQFDTLDIKVNKKPIVDFASNKDSFCVGETLQLVNNSVGGLTYNWTFGDGQVSSDFEPNISFKLAGSYDVTLSALSDKNCNSELEKSNYITVIDLPIADFVFTPNQPNYLNPEVKFIQRSSNYVSFEWDFGDFNKELFIESPLHKYTDTGYYSVRLIAMNQLGCSDTAYKTVRVKDVYVLNIPTAITVNNDNINEYFVVIGRGIVSYEMQVFSRWGEQVYEGTESSEPFDGKDRNGENLMKGSYLVMLTIRDFEGGEHYVRQMLEIL
jgi:Zn-dependent metalloprotease